MTKLLLKLTGFICLLVVFTGCSNESLVDLQEESNLHAKQSASKMDKMTFTTHLSGVNEVPERDTNATGEAIVRINKDELSIHFKLIVANVQADITGAHFHMGPAGVNAGVVVNLLNISDYPPNTNAPANGVLAEGTITASNLSGALSEKPLSDLISAIKAGNIYINVHTTTYPGGEIRGQL